MPHRDDRRRTAILLEVLRTRGPRFPTGDPPPPLRTESLAPFSLCSQAGLVLWGQVFDDARQTALNELMHWQITGRDA
jgi:hypothetical protein